ncbi:glycosyltransferase [Planosporangium flavigriseum]|uniref:glycosyltransferase family 2 protein n=1 Tax=Planosporangium flavigriseum TaxID=373681 RepID=UPI00143A0537|nr:glycosyltransferase [Planosporangium flavigriseum]NJC65428.1 glycosyltransferase [Planosporangium flavigriseum]
MNQITVVIASRNRADVLPRTIARLRALPDRPPVILVDNGSSDGTPYRIHRAFPEVRVAREPAARAAVGQLAARLPRALWRRRAPRPAVEAALARLDDAQLWHGYFPDGPGSGPRSRPEVGRLARG